MSRLRTRKQEIGEQIESRKAGARFEVTDPTAEAGPPPVVGLEPGAVPKPTMPAKPEEKPETSPGESYTERLLKAKKQVSRDRDEEQK